MWDSIRIDAHPATLREGKYGVIRRAALAADDGRIAWIGARAGPQLWGLTQKHLPFQIVED